MREVVISAVNTHGGNSHSGKDSEFNWDDVTADMSVPDRYYKSTEYKALSLEQKAGLIKKREKRGGPPRRGGKPQGKKTTSQKKNGGKDKNGVHISNRSIKALVSAMSLDDTTEATAAESDDDSDEEVEMAAPATGKKWKNNRNNPALKRQKTKGRG